MKYIGNIEKLRNSIFVKDKIEKIRLTPKFIKIISDAVVRYEHTSVTKEQLMTEYKISESKSKYILTEIRKKRKISKQKHKNIINKTTCDTELYVEQYSKLCEIRTRYETEILVHGEQTSVPEGFIYLISNPVWNGWVKAGMTIDFQSRLTTYNVNDPFNNFKYFELKWVNNRRDAEKILLSNLETISEKRYGEWFLIDQKSASEIFHKI